MLENENILKISQDAYEKSLGFKLEYDFKNNLFLKVSEKDRLPFIACQFKYGERYCAKLFLNHLHFLLDIKIGDIKSILYLLESNDVWVYDCIQFFTKYFKIDALEIFMNINVDPHFKRHVVNYFLDCPGVLLEDKAFLKIEFKNNPLNQTIIISERLIREGALPFQASNKDEVIRLINKIKGSSPNGG